MSKYHFHFCEELAACAVENWDEEGEKTMSCGDEFYDMLYELVDEVRVSLGERAQRSLDGEERYCDR